MALELCDDGKLTGQIVQRNHILANSVEIKKVSDHVEQNFTLHDSVTSKETSVSIFKLY